MKLTSSLGRFARPKLLSLATDDKAIALGVCLLILLAYVPLAYFRYAFADDYAYLIVRASRATSPLLMGDGRILGGLMARALFTTFNTISSVAVLRVIVLAELIVVLFLLQRAAVLTGLNAMWAGLVAIAFATSPSVQHWVVWGVASWQFPALILGVATYFPWRRLIDADGRVSTGNLVCFVAFPFLAMLMYQPFATAAWPLIVLDVLMHEGDKRPYRKIVVAVAAFCAALMLAFVVSKILITTFVPVGGKDRLSFVAPHEIPDKLRWFLFDPIMTALTPLEIRGRPIIALTVLGIIVIGLAISVHSPKEFGAALFVIVFAVLIANAPSLATAENTPIRCHVVIALQVFVMLGFALQQIAGRLKLTGPGIATAVAACCLALSIWASSVVIRYNAIPQSLELALIERVLANTKLPDDRPIVLIGLPDGTSITGRYCEYSDIIGCAASDFLFTLPMVVKLWMREHGYDPARYVVLYMQTKDDPQAVWFDVVSRGYVPVPANAYFLDLGSVVMGRRAP